ncbi:MAG: BamA/TamA family outer membrane protein [Chitinophagaceae bacterium]|nr:BamA/TamA family outer membrane protein [Chitinophagaceae bacterium]
MAKLTVYHKISGLLLVALICTISSKSQYKLHIHPVDKDSVFITETLKLQTNFSARQNCIAYVNKLPAFLKTKGYPNASIDSVTYDSLDAHCELYIGEPLRHTILNTDSIEHTVLIQSGISNRRKKGGLDVQQVQEKILSQMENTGYPFASVRIDSVYFRSDSMFATVRLDKGPLYKIDSIRNYGNASISSSFLQQYLGIKNGSIYRKERMKDISERLRELPYLQEKQPWNLSLLGTGSVLNLYLDPRKSSEVNVLIGLLPANEQLADNKMLVTGEANINLKNSLGGGETIGVNWQQIQVKSPRLNIVFQQPYLFGTPFGMNFSFDLLKKDSSYVNIGILLGAAYAVSSRQTGSVFIQRLTTNLLTVDTFSVKNSKRLPPEADVSSVNLGVNYEWLTTDYRFNPRRGNEFSITASAGTRNIKKNNVIVKLTDNADPEFNFNSLYDTFQLKSYQFRVRAKAAHYFPLGKGATVKTAVTGGWFQSPNIFRNELFQIGGYKLLRGFDEESIFSSAFGVGTLEYRYLLGRNSFLAAFMDYGVSTNNSLAVKVNNSFLGAGIGMAFETKAGIFNITYAAGKRDDQKFNLRQSKIHLGYVNYF